MNRGCAITSTRTFWPTSRILVFLAGAVTLATPMFAATVSDRFLLWAAQSATTQLMVINRFWAWRSRRASPAR